MDIIGNDDNLGKSSPEITPFLAAFISMFKEKRASATDHMRAYLSFQLASAPEGAAVVELDKRIMDTSKSKEALADTIRTLRSTHGDDMESLALCMDSWVNTRDTPKEYNDLLVQRVIRVEDLPARYKHDAVAIRYIHLPAYKTKESWVGQFGYSYDKGGNLVWQEPTWILVDGSDTTLTGIFSDL